MSAVPVRKSGRITRGRPSVEPAVDTAMIPSTSTSNAPEIKVKSFQEVMAAKRAAKLKPEAEPVANESTSQTLSQADVLALRRQKLLERKQAQSQSQQINQSSSQSVSQPSTPAVEAKSSPLAQSTNQSPPHLPTLTTPSMSQSPSQTPQLDQANRTLSTPSMNQPPKSPLTHSISQTIIQSPSQPINQTINQISTPNRKPSTPIHHSIVTAPSSIHGVELTRTIHTPVIDTESDNQSINQSVNQSADLPVKHSRSLENQSPQPAAKRIKRSASKMDQSTIQTIFQSINPQSINHSVNQSANLSINFAEIDAELALFEAEIRKLQSINQLPYQSIDQWMAEHPLSLAEADELLEDFEEEQSNQSINQSVNQSQPMEA